MKNFVVLFLLLCFVSCFSSKQYGMVVDAGSSGTRLHVFLINVSNRAPSFEYIEGHSTSPGLTKDPSCDSLISLLENGLKTVPRTFHKNTLLLLRATAGMRALVWSDAEEIMKNARSRVKEQYVLTGVLREENVDMSIVHGEEEGLYAWLSVNTMFKRLVYNINDDGTLRVALGKDIPFGVLDLGGSSQQSVFHTSTLPRSNGFIYSSSSDPNEEKSDPIFLFIRSLTGAGVNAALVSLSEYLLDTGEKNNPCLFDGYETDGTESGLIPMGDYDECLRVVKKWMTAKDVDHIPLFRGEFVGIESYLYVSEFFGLGTNSDGGEMEMSLPSLEKASKKLCTMKWNDVSGVYKMDDYLAKRCFHGAYIFAHLTEYYGVDGKGALQLADASYGWTLGALVDVLHQKPHFPVISIPDESETECSEDVHDDPPVSWQSSYNMFWLFFAIALIAGIVLYVIRVKRGKVPGIRRSPSGLV